MKCSVDVRCIVCQLVFCCGNCRWKHEQSAHGMTYNCPICRGQRFLCRPNDLHQEYIEHLVKEHSPLQCRKCNKILNNMDDFINIKECTSITELVDKEATDNNKSDEVDERFDSLYEKVSTEGDNIEAIVSVNKHTKTAIITPIVRKKYLVDYETSGSEDEETPEIKAMRTPHPKLPPKTPKNKRHRAATPHLKKFMSLMRQKEVDFEETVDEKEIVETQPVNNKTTPLRNENDVVADPQKEMTTPTSHLTYLLKQAQMVTTSTPTHPAAGGFSIFSEQGADSPLSEIENTESPGQDISKEPSKSESELLPKLKSIIVTGSRIRLGSQDSTEKQVTFQDSNNEASSVKIKKVKFAEDTVFEQEPKVKRVYRKPKRMLTPGPQKPRYCFNPRFQALINRFENQGITMARTPVNTARTPVNTNKEREQSTDFTPGVGDHANVMPARAINFKEDSPVIETDYSKESDDNFKSCVASPIADPRSGMNNALTALTSNIAGSLQTCIDSALRTAEEETEIQFKFVITKKKVCVNRVADQVEKYECTEEVFKNREFNKENIWSTVAKAVKSVFWGDQSMGLATTTPLQIKDFNDTTSSSASKRKCEEMSDSESPLNHKRHKYEGRIRGRPPLRKIKTMVSGLRSSVSAEQQSLMKQISLAHEEMNQSF